MTGGALIVAMSLTYSALLAPLFRVVFALKFIPRGGVTAGFYSAATVASIPTVILEDMKVC